LDKNEYSLIKQNCTRKVCANTNRLLIYQLKKLTLVDIKLTLVDIKLTYSNNQMKFFLYIKPTLKGNTSEKMSRGYTQHGGFHPSTQFVNADQLGGRRSEVVGTALTLMSRGMRRY
jgi:hypothetical protein